jgi:hypothetical protein
MIGMLLNGLVFKPAFAFDGDNVEVYDQKLFESVSGVYAVFVGLDLLYIGSYSNALQQRWINKKLDKFIHFKADKIIEIAKEKQMPAIVYVLTRSEIREQISDSDYVNHESVESHLVSMFDPLLNNVKKNDKNKFSQSKHID